MKRRSMVPLVTPSIILIGLVSGKSEDGWRS